MTCPKTGKRGFGSKAKARRANRNLGNKLRVYLCPHCRRFHITSLERPT